MAKKMHTFGYEGLNIDQFVLRLVDEGVRTVVDVRANPLSRKPGFSKRALSTHLEGAGIKYIHVVEVGCPKPVRDRYKIDRNWSIYTKGFKAYLQGQSGAIDQIAKIAAKTKICLICFEADHNFCHRSFVADAVAAVTGIKVDHLKGRMSSEAAQVAA